MNEQTESPLTGAEREPVAPMPATTDRAQSHSALPWACAIGFLLLAGGLFYVWQNPSLPPEVASAGPQLRAEQQRLADLESRLSRLEQRPAPQPPAPQVSAADIAKLNARLDAAEARSPDPAQLGGRFDALSGRVESLSGRVQAGLDGAKQQADAIAGRVATLEKNSTSVASVSSRVDKLARLQDAMIALAAGKPVGDIAGAPPAISRYAHQAPPTAAHLRLSFPDAERAALAAEQPDLANAPFVDRVWERAQGLVTVKRGDEVVVGNSSAVALGQAKAALDAGDLPLAVDTLSKLADAPKKAMAGWLNEAKALIAARSALADMAGQI